MYSDSDGERRQDRKLTISSRVALIEAEGARHYFGSTRKAALRRGPGRDCGVDYLLHNVGRVFAVWRRIRGGKQVVCTCAWGRPGDCEWAKAVDGANKIIRCLIRRGAVEEADRIDLRVVARLGGKGDGVACDGGIGAGTELVLRLD